MKFLPVPPKTSLAMTTPNVIPSATCQSGVVAGSDERVENRRDEEALVDLVIANAREQNLPETAPR